MWRTSAHPPHIRLPSVRMMYGRARVRRAVRMSAATAALVAGLAGCAGGVRSEEVSAPPTAVFPSDEEAYRAAITAYRGYLDMATTISSEGGHHGARILDVAGTRHADDLLAEFRAMREAGTRTTGEPELRAGAADLVAISADRGQIELQVCLDVSGVRTLDAAGADVTPNRAEATPLIVTMTAFAPDQLIVTGSAASTDDALC